MAKLKLGEYEMELALVKVWTALEAYDYLVTFTCRGVNLLQPWRNMAKKGKREALKEVYLPADVPFDQCFRPLLTEEWPIKLTDCQGGGSVTVIAWPSAWIPAIEQSPWISPWEHALVDLADAAADRWADQADERAGKSRPKRFHLDRDDQMEKVRFNFQFSPAVADTIEWPRKDEQGWANLGFDAYVEYDALATFLDELEAERKVMEQRAKRNLRRQELREAKKRG